ncbi:MAG TPA: hypothetical protein VHW24_05825 [Bryobacteraceae bacterium]|jgi:hypothetical protein|nr:hypothetical protein [Bryobacteraceae bacterium]
MTLDEFLKCFEYLAQGVEAVDEAARKAFDLALFSYNLRPERASLVEKETAPTLP